MHIYQCSESETRKKLKLTYTRHKCVMRFESGKLGNDAGKVNFYALFHYVGMKTFQSHCVIDFNTLGRLFAFRLQL